LICDHARHALKEFRTLPGSGPDNFNRVLASYRRDARQIGAESRNASVNLRAPVRRVLRTSSVGIDEKDPDLLAEAMLATSDLVSACDN
jgi:hypothetical protein